METPERASARCTVEIENADGKCKSNSNDKIANKTLEIFIFLDCKNYQGGCHHNHTMVWCVVDQHLKGNGAQLKKPVN